MTSEYEQIRAMGYSDEVIQAWNVMKDDGVNGTDAAKLAAWWDVAHRGGYLELDVVGFARQYVRLRRENRLMEERERERGRDGDQADQRPQPGGT